MVKSSIRFVIAVFVFICAWAYEAQVQANPHGDSSAQVDSVFVTTRTGAVLRTKGGVEVAPVEAGLRLLAIDYDPYAWGGRWLVGHNGRTHYLRDSDVVASDADRKLVQHLFFERKTGESAAIRDRHFGLKGKRRWVSANTANVRETPDQTGKVIRELFHDQDVYMDEEAGGWSRVAYKGPFAELQPERKFQTLADYERACSFGWIHNSLLSNKPPELRAADEEEAQWAAIAKTRRQSFVAANQDLPSEFSSAIMAGNIVRGMSPEMVRASLGAPLSVNRSVGSWGVNEQWVYHNLYAYLDNGVLTSWQESISR